MFTLTVVVTVMVIVALYQKYTNHSLFINIVYVFNFFFLTKLETIWLVMITYMLQITINITMLHKGRTEPHHSRE